MVNSQCLGEGPGVPLDSPRRTLAAVCHSRFPNLLLLIVLFIFWRAAGKEGRKLFTFLFSLLFGFLLKLRLSDGFN